MKMSAAMPVSVTAGAASGGVVSLAALGLPRDPARQRPPLLPVLLGARARQIEHGQAVARAVDIHLRIAQVRHARKLRLLHESVELAGGQRARIDAHADQAHRELALLDRLVFADGIEETLRRI